jgi:hypothetical protein
VRAKYFKSLPVLEDAAGQARLKDDSFELVISSGHATMPSGARAQLQRGQFNASNLLSGSVPGKFLFDIRGSVPALLEYAALPDLRLTGGDSSSLPRLSGTGQAVVGLEFPMVKNVPRSSIRITTDVKLMDAAVPAVLPGVDLTDGRFDVAITPEAVAVKGPAKLNGVASHVAWSKPRGAGQARIDVETVLDAKLRNKLGVRLDEFMSGDVPVKIAVAGGGTGGRVISVSADLSEVSMKVAAAGWSRPATAGTRATFKVIDDG